MSEKTVPDAGTSKVEMSLTKALANLKKTEKKISDKTQKLLLIGVKVRGVSTIPDIRAEEELRSVTDLINYRLKLKTAISAANAVTELTIGSETMTIAQAIEKKHSIVFMEELLRKMTSQYASAVNLLQHETDKMERNLQGMLEASAGSKGQSRETTALEAAFRETNKAELDDPIDLKKKIEEMQSEIDDFVEEVDVALSEINARTTILV